MAVATVGDTAEATLEVSTDGIDRFAALVGDDNPLHTDESYAAEGPLDGRVAHGMLSASVVSAALAELPGDVVYLSQDMEFPAPVRPGDTVRANVEVVEGVGDDRLRVATTAETGDATVLEGEATILSVPHEGSEGSGDAEAAAADD